jgi:mono/diheme cytochrome c family protein
MSNRSLYRAALAGLMGTTACGDEPSATPDPIRCPTVDAGVGLDAEVGADAGAPDAGAADAGPVVTSEVEGNRTYASLTEDCDARGGYVQIHAACAGVNACRGFSYGDWDPGVLTEHTCAGVNGCNGLSCVELPEDGGRTGQEVYEAELPESGPRACTNCHAAWGDDGPDASVFKIYTLPGSGRTLDNWLDLPAEAQARIVAFGSTGRLPDGTALAHMSAYHRIFSRAEIERAVEYVRSELTPMVVEYRVGDE